MREHYRSRDLRSKLTTSLVKSMIPIVKISDKLLKLKSNSKSASETNVSSKQASKEIQVSSSPTQSKSEGFYIGMWLYICSAFPLKTKMSRQTKFRERESDIEWKLNPQLFERLIFLRSIPSVDLSASIVK